MRAGFRRIVAAGAIAALVPALAAPLARAGSDPAGRARAADSLRDRAAAYRAAGTLDGRRQAMSDLERASLLAPEDHRVWLDLGRLCLETGQRARGRACYDRARRAAPDDAEAHAALGSAWTWEWLGSFEPTALAHAERDLERAAELAPGRAAAWGELAALSLSRGRLEQAERAAERGLAADPGAWEPLVALACVSYRQARLARADSAFAAARARAPEELRARFEATPWAPEGEPGAIGDPDLTTPENEAELDYLTRLGLALLLFRDGHGVRWDMRTELFVRYGPPATVDVNPLSSPLSMHYHRPAVLMYAPEPIEYPYNVQAWSYPELGMRTELWDRSLTQSFVLPPAFEDEAEPRPDPMLLAGRPDLVSLGGGRGVFRAMAPGSKPVPARGQVARFPSGQGVVLLAHVVTPGEPGDSLTGAWAVVAADGRAIARATRTLSASACDPASQQVADFSAIVPPGEYRVDLSVSGRGGRRGLVRLGATVPPQATGLGLSDLVMLCGAADATPSPDAVRIEPDMERRFSGPGPLSVYFEIDRLTPGADGRSRFAYRYSLTPVAREDKRSRVPQVAFEASREESQDGAHRRQFVTIPMRSVKPGLYDLRIEVRDLVAGTVAAAGLRFARE